MYMVQRKTYWLRQLMRVLLSLPLTGALLLPPAQAALTVLMVDTTAQRNSVLDLPDNCTLGDAIVAANNDAPEDGCMSPNLGTGGPFEIVLSAEIGPYILSVVDNAGGNGGNGLPLISATVTVQGNGNTIQRDATFTCPDRVNDDFRILEVGSTGDLTLKSVTIRNGCASTPGLPARGHGGGILNSGGAVTLDNTIITDNASFSAGRGGGIYNAEGTLTLTKSTVSDNAALDDVGGGIGNQDGEMTLTETVVLRNSGKFVGAGIWNSLGTLTLVDSVVSDNTRIEPGEGCGIYSEGSAIPGGGDAMLTVRDSTISGNDGSGIRNAIRSVAFVSNTTVSGNSQEGIWTGQSESNMTVVTDLSIFPQNQLHYWTPSYFMGLSPTSTIGSFCCLVCYRVSNYRRNTSACKKNQ